MLEVNLPFEEANTFSAPLGSRLSATHIGSFVRPWQENDLVFVVPGGGGCASLVPDSFYPRFLPSALALLFGVLPVASGVLSGGFSAIGRIIHLGCGSRW